MTDSWLKARDEHEATVAKSMRESITDPERLADMALVSTAIKASGLSASAFARDILVRNPRAIFRMLAGEVPLSPVVRARCQAMIDLAKSDATMATPPPRRKSAPTSPARTIPDPDTDGPIIIDLRNR